MELVFHTTSGASRSGPASTYSNVVTVLYKSLLLKLCQRLPQSFLGPSKALRIEFHTILSFEIASAIFLRDASFAPSRAWQPSESQPR